MRVAYVSADPGVPVFGSKGCSVHVQEVIRALRRSGAEVELHTVRSGGEACLDLAGLRVFEVPLDRSGGTASVEQRAQKASENLLAGLLQRPVYDLVYERYSLWSTAAVDFAAASGIPSVIEVNSPLVEEQAAHRNLVDRERADQVARHVFGAASVVVAVSRAVADYVQSRGADPRRVHVLPNGVDPGRFHPRSDDPKRGAFTVGFVGSLKPWHDLGTLVAAHAMLLRSHPDSRLLVVGDGPERERVEAWLASAGIEDSALFPGAVRPDEVPEWMGRMDVGVAPYARDASRYFSPLKVLEYMAAALPVLGSATGQIPELVEHRASGLLYEAEDARALASAMAFLADDPHLRRRMGAAGRAAVLQHHTWEGVVASTLDLARRAEARLGAA